MKKTQLFVLIILWSICSKAQDVKMYCDDKVINLQYSVENATIVYHKKFDNRKVKDKIKENFKDKIDTIYDFTEGKNPFSIIQFTKNKLDKKGLLPELRKVSDDSLFTVYPFVVTDKGSRLGITNRINILLKPNTEFKDFQNLFEEFTITQIEQNRFNPLLYHITIKSPEPLSMVNKLFATKQFATVENDAILIGKFDTQDPRFEEQRNIPLMSVQNAWLMSTGANIKVAIIDGGVELTHPDLAANLYNQGYDATGERNDGSCRSYDYHGTSCAGVVAAIANNNIGIAGIAYDSKIIPIRAGYKAGWSDNLFVTSPSKMTDAMNYAKNIGADIISISLSLTEVGFGTFKDAMDDAANNGRNGNGCLIFASSGNDGDDECDFPAFYSKVIAVGASNGNNIDPISNYGAGLNVVCPLGVLSLDNLGSNGINSTDYNENFGGTSSACPQAAAVMALILSVNPNLTRSEAKHVIESTCDKIGSYIYSPAENGTRSFETGYGRVNACRSVWEEYEQTLAIIGSSDVCAGQTAVYSISNIKPGISVNWSYAGNFNYISGQVTNNYTLQATNSNGISSIYATVSIAGCGSKSITKDVWVGLYSNFSGDHIIPYHQTGTYTATAVCGTEPYLYEWFLRKASTGEESGWIANGSQLTLQSVTPGSSMLAVQKGNASVDVQSGGSTVFYLSLRTYDAYGNLYFSPEQLVEAYGNVDLIPAYMPDYLVNTSKTTVQSEYVEVYPNPAKDNITVKIVSPTVDLVTDNIQLTLTDRNMKTLQIVKPKSRESSIQLSGYKKDVYFLHVMFNNRKWVEKVLIE